MLGPSIKAINGVYVYGRGKQMRDMLIKEVDQHARTDLIYNISLVIAAP